MQSKPLRNGPGGPPSRIYATKPSGSRKAWACAHHHALVAWPPHDRREHGARRVIAGKPALHHAGSIVAHQRRHLSIVGHRAEAAHRNLP